MIDFDQVHPQTIEDSHYVKCGAALLLIIREWIVASGCDDVSAIEIVSFAAGLLVKENGMDLDHLRRAAVERKPDFDRIVALALALALEGCGDPDCQTCGDGGTDEADDEDDEINVVEDWKR